MLTVIVGVRYQPPHEGRVTDEVANLPDIKKKFELPDGYPIPRAGEVVFLQRISESDGICWGWVREVVYDLNNQTVSIELLVPAVVWLSVRKVCLETGWLEGTAPGLYQR